MFGRQLPFFIAGVVQVGGQLGTHFIMGTRWSSCVPLYSCVQHRGGALAPGVARCVPGGCAPQ